MSKLDDVCARINRENKELIVSRGVPAIVTEKIPFTSPRVNYMTYGGLPRGRLIEFFGEENGGKTTTALDVCRNAQNLFYQEYEEQLSVLESLVKPTKEDRATLEHLRDRGPFKVVYADIENTLDEDWAELLGVDTESMYVIKPQDQHGETIFQMILDMIETGEVGLVILDSIGVMLSKQEFEKTMEDKTYGGISAALTLFSKKANLMCKRFNTTLIGINQLREDINSPYNLYRTPGGKAWKFVCCVRLCFRKGDYLGENREELRKSTEAPFGNKVQIDVAKTKAFPPKRKLGYYTLCYDKGVDHVYDLVEVAQHYDIIRKSGSWFYLIDDQTGEVIQDESGNDLRCQGSTNMMELLEKSPQLLAMVANRVNENIT